MTDRYLDGAAETARLVALWEQHMSCEFTPRPGLHQSNAVQIWTFAHHAARLSRAVLALHQAAYDLEAMSLIRQTLECGVNASWLLVTEGGGAALSAVDTKNRRIMFGEVTELGLGDHAETHRRLAEEEARNAQMVTKTRSFEERCRAIAGGRWLYTVWRTLSLYSHASSSVADLYLETVPETQEAPLGVAVLLNADWEQADTWLRIQALMLLLAQIAADQARAKPMHRTQLDKAQRRLGVDWEIRRAEGD